MVLGYAFYVLGSDLPDLDHPPDALIHRGGAKPIASVAVGSAVYLWASGWVNLSPEWASVVAAWVIGAVGALVGWYAFTWLMPHHRGGIVHSLLFAAVYGLLAFLLVEYGLRMSTGGSYLCGTVRVPGLHPALTPRRFPETRLNFRFSVHTFVEQGF